MRNRCFVGLFAWHMKQVNVRTTRLQIEAWILSEFALLLQFQKSSFLRKFFFLLIQQIKLKNRQEIHFKLFYKSVFLYITLSPSIAYDPSFLCLFSRRKKFIIFAKSIMLSKAHVDYRICAPLFHPIFVMLNEIHMIMTLIHGINVSRLNITFSTNPSALRRA